MKIVVVATRNRGKQREIECCLDGVVDKVLCAADFESFPETIEDGSTFEENAMKKAREAMQFTGMPALADDSGLEVAVLGGAPGVYSARYAGEGAGDAANNFKLLDAIKGVPWESRKAAFVCSLAFVAPDGTERLFRGRIEGHIIDDARGDGGFGYDPLFLVDIFDKTMAELAMEEKNRISHRGQALKAFKLFLDEYGDQY